LTAYKFFTDAEKSEIMVFSAQETIISVTYLCYAWAWFKSLSAIRKVEATKFTMHLAIVNLFIIALDMVLLTLEFTTDTAIWGSFKGFAYSIKLKLEFHILNRLQSVLIRDTATMTELSPYNPGDYHDSFHFTFNDADSRGTNRTSSQWPGR
jgi:hypothetical protein